MLQKKSSKGRPCSKGNANCRVSIIRRRSKSECMLGGITSKYSRDSLFRKKSTPDDEPVKAIRSKKDASMVVAAKAVKEGEADALFSCGNTGALLTAGLLVVGRIKGIDRPGLMPVLPVLGKDNRQFIMMDVGANAECKPKNVHQFGILGSYYSKYVLGYENPTVGLLNNGAEEGKGNELAKEVYGLLKEDESLNFVGNVEARDILTGAADVVVTDGFTGNAVLKTIEGTALAMMGLLKEGIKGQGIQGKLGALLFKNTFYGLKNTLDYSQFGVRYSLVLKEQL